MAYREANRYLYLTTPLGEDQLLLRGFSGQEAISQLFRFDLDLLAENQTDVAFDELIGQKVSFGIQGVDPGQTPRHFHGIVVECTQGRRDDEFTSYQLRIVPEIWKLSRKFRSRMFQHISIPDVLKKILSGFDVAYQLQGTFEPREYLVQYQETDLDFAARLMEEEGIYYFFQFTRGAHQLILANTPQSHQDLPGGSTVLFETVEGGVHDEERISGWSKVQHWSSGKYTVWDHQFELPHKNLEAVQIVQDSVQAGKITHKLKVGGNEAFEVYENPGGYSHRFDGIDKGGGDKTADLQKIFQDNKRTVGIRMQQVELPALLIRGASSYRQIVPGYKFTLQRHFNADGQYVVLSAMHNANEGGFRSGETADHHYGNAFTCIPLALPFRPQRVTERPVIHGPQSAVVVGPSGEEIFTDKYGRIKVQFHWDREGKNDADSSCWLRVTTSWAGQNWGSIHLPRKGQEVIVSFIEGDPDRPLVTGSVYNPNQMPPYTLPDKKTVSTLKSRSTKQGTNENYNELRFEDLKGQEQIYMHAERDLDVRVNAESREIIGANRHLDVGVSQTENVGENKASNIGQDYTVTVGANEYLTVQSNLAEKIGSNHEVTVGSNETETIGANSSLTVGSSRSVDVQNDLSVTVGSSYQEKVGMKYALNAGSEVHIKSGATLVIESGTTLTLMVGGNFINISSAGVAIQGTMVLINSGGVAGMGTGSSPDSPDKPSINVKKAGPPDKADDGPKFDKS